MGGTSRFSLPWCLRLLREFSDFGRIPLLQDKEARSFRKAHQMTGGRISSRLSHRRFLISHSIEDIRINLVTHVKIQNLSVVVEIDSWRIYKCVWSRDRPRKHNTSRLQLRTWLYVVRGLQTSHECITIKLLFSRSYKSCRGYTFGYRWFMIV